MLLALWVWAAAYAALESLLVDVERRRGRRWRDGVPWLAAYAVVAPASTAVGRALAEVGRHHQVFVVTHLAQVAAQATTQVTVVKSVAGDVTTARAAVVDGDVHVGAERARRLVGSWTPEASPVGGWPRSSL